MWLPEPVYESLPYVYVGCGASIVAGAVYLGIGNAGTPYYILIGILSIVGGVVIYLRRKTARQSKTASDLSDSDY